MIVTDLALGFERGGDRCAKLFGEGDHALHAIEGTVSNNDHRAFGAFEQVCCIFQRRRRWADAQIGHAAFRAIGPGAVWRRFGLDIVREDQMPDAALQDRGLDRFERRFQVDVLERVNADNLVLYLPGQRQRRSPVDFCIP